MIRKTIKVRLIKSLIGVRESHCNTIRGLGLRRLHSISFLQDTRSVRGMLDKTSYLIEVVNIKN